MDLAIRCLGLRKVYDGRPPVEALAGVDLEVGAGECFGLLGPNGAGKTTTVEILEGLLEPTAGEVEVLGRRWDGADDELRQRIGVSLQETRLADKLTVEETLRLFSSFYRRGRPAREVVEDLGLGEKRRAWVVNLSGASASGWRSPAPWSGTPSWSSSTSRRPASTRSRGASSGTSSSASGSAPDGAPDDPLHGRGRAAVRPGGGGRPRADHRPRDPRAAHRLAGGEHVVEFALNGHGRPAGDLAAEQLLALPTVTAAHAEPDALSLTVGAPHLAIPALLGLLGAAA